MLLTHDRYCMCPECQARRPDREARRAMWQNIKDLEETLELADRNLAHVREHFRPGDECLRSMVERAVEDVRTAVEAAYRDLKDRGMVLHYGGGVLVPHAVIGEYAWFDPQGENWIGRLERHVRGVAAYAPLSETDPCWQGSGVMDCWAAVEARHAGVGA